MSRFNWEFFLNLSFTPLSNSSLISKLFLFKYYNLIYVTSTCHTSESLVSIYFEFIGRKLICQSEIIRIFVSNYTTNLELRLISSFCLLGSTKLSCYDISRSRQQQKLDNAPFTPTTQNKSTFYNVHPHF